MLSNIEKTKLRTWVELDCAAIKHNYNLYKKLIDPRCILMAVVKSNAYGHGIVPFSKELESLGVNFFGVDSFDEAIELREAGISGRILVLSYVSPFLYADAIKKNITLSISNFPALENIKKVKFTKKLKIHLKFDTGLGRQGFLDTDMPKVLNFLKNKDNQKFFELEGIFSHLAVGEDLGGKEYTKLQVERLNKWEKEINSLGYKPLKHICSSASTMFYTEYHFDIVRIGIGMYGLWSSKELKLAMRKKYKLHPVLSWKAIITEVKKLPKGAKIGYDLTKELKRNSTVGIVPVGYWHGYPRLLSSKGTFNVNGKKVKILGRVSMDMISLDLTGIKAKIGDDVAIIGGDHGHYAEADVMAQDSDTINYEIVTRINPIIKRYYRINPFIKRILK